MTITGGTGSDTLAMENAADVMDGGTKTGTSDTLAIAGTYNSGGFTVDLTSSTDQVTLFNGSANSAVQKNFESVDLSGVTAVTGATITGTTAANTIKGTNVSDTINGGLGADLIYSGNGADTVTFTETTDSEDRFYIENTSGVKSSIDTITGFTSTDKIYIDLSASGQFGDLHDSDGDAFDDGDQTAAVVAINIAGGNAAITAAKNVLSFNADTSALGTGYAAFSNLATALDGIAALTESGSGDFTAGDELLSVFYNTGASAYEVGILTIVGDEGLDEGDDTWEGLVRVDSTGITQAQVAASIVFYN
jgi:Ca2+-binding RTX toxin-like protein